MRDPANILQEAARTLDFTQPVAVMLLGILGYVGDYDEVRAILRRVLDAVPSGSYLVSNDGTRAKDADIEANRTAQRAGLQYHLRSQEQFAGFFDGLELLEPGVVSTPGGDPTPARWTTTPSWPCSAAWRESPDALRPGRHNSPSPRRLCWFRSKPCDARLVTGVRARPAPSPCRTSNHLVDPDGRCTATLDGVSMRSDGLHVTPAAMRRIIAPWLLPRLASLAAIDRL